MTMTLHYDSFGNTWPYGPGYENEYCPTCGQPDNCGDCSHDPLDAEDVLALGGILPARIIPFTEFRPGGPIPLPTKEAE